MLPTPMKAADSSREFANNPTAPMFTDPNQVIEPKIDGVRALLVSDNNHKSLWIGTSGRRVQHSIPQILLGIDRIADIVLDGELLIPGQPLGKTVGALNSSGGQGLMKAKFYVFDLLSISGADYRDLPLNERREALEELFDQVISKSTAWIELVPQFDPEPITYEAIRKAEFEGFMAKDKFSKYSAGRSNSWRKVKWTSTVDCFVIGSEPGHGSNSDKVGALVMGVLDDSDEVVEIGKQGVFTNEMRQAMSNPDGTLNPEWMGKVMEITYQSVGTNRRMRHPRLLRLRPDKEAFECRMDQFEKRGT